ncbi:hypothetical protein [Parathermosynechococcus lividus]
MDTSHKALLPNLNDKWRTAKDGVPKWPIAPRQRELTPALEGRGFYPG